MKAKIKRTYKATISILAESRRDAERIAQRMASGQDTILLSVSAFKESD